LSYEQVITMLHGNLLAVLLLVASAPLATSQQLLGPQRHTPTAQAKGHVDSLFSADPLPQQQCGEPPVQGLELTPAEQELLQYICWPPEGVEGLLEAEQAARLGEERRGVPPGVNCTVVPW
jgi:hypothetical protein